eukprot:4758444-Amphidinium_carterae.1
MISVELQFNGNGFQTQRLQVERFYERTCCAWAAVIRKHLASNTHTTAALPTTLRAKKLHHTRVLE